MLMVLLCAGAWTSAVTPTNSTLAEFEQWMARHGRIYKDNLEKPKRYGIFLETLRFIEDFNSKATNQSYKVGLNQFSDLTTEEFVSRYTGFRATSRSSNSSAATTFKYSTTQVPDSLNWVEKGVVGSIKDQGECGSCWAFAATATVESMLAMKTGKLVDLSEQQLIDCSKQNVGCKWGWTYRAYEYIAQNHGMTYESNYPYSGVEGPCNERAASIAVARLKGYEKIPMSEDLVLQAVARQPVSVAIEGASPGFKQYSGGIFNGPCGETSNHIVVIVGYGKTPDGVDYWLLKNSWGETWGEKGYMRMLRNSGVQGGLCGLVTHATLPVSD
ncbi:hypothetical protein EUGRSUZ_E02718 [Eucalyptus grandis]|uniref:Uncharacterized protein n=2 Tax=Eucalyptus grandis TaxID=71139 RepID=A0ACC3KXV5_EUCGR|nr:hypothetical protein EUGRSUZ_E02718 [Eucalyptus grandis]